MKKEILNEKKYKVTDVTQNWYFKKMKIFTIKLKSNNELIKSITNSSNLAYKSKLHLNVWFNLCKASKLLIILTILISGISCSMFTANSKKSQQASDSDSRTPMEKIAETLTKKISTPNARIIVLTFTTTEGNEHKLGNLFAEKLTTDLVRRGNVIVLDRMLFSKQLSENNLSLNSGSDLKEIRKVGEILGLNAIVTGMVTSFNTGYGLNCRIIDPKTGFIISAEEAYYAGE